MAKNNNITSIADDLGSVFPETRIVKVKGRDIEISPFKFKVLLKVLTHVNNILDDSGFLDQYTILQTLLRGISQHPDDLIGILKLSTNVTEDSFYDEIDAVDGVNLLLATWEVNKDFFSQKLGGALKSLFPSQETE